MQGRNKILVVGNDSIPKKTLIEVPDASWSSVEGSTVLKCPFTVETKYFHAPVEFWLYEGSCPEVFGELGGVADGLVLFFDPADTHSWVEVKGWERFIEEAQPNVILCVPVSRVAEPAVFIDWCIDHQVEFVHMYPTADADEGEKFGMERVLEAVGSNQWASLVMKAQPSQPPRQVSNTPTTGSLFSGLEVVGEEKPAVEEELHHSGSSLEFLDELKGESFDLEKALTQMQDLKSRASSLPDSERRALAASVALKFAMLLGDDDDDDDDELDFQ